MRRLLLLALIGAPIPGSAHSETVTVIAGARYRAGPLHRFVFGAGYRDLWTTPIRVPVLDLRKFAGGLTPTETGGRRQTISLRFEGADGKEYHFRSVDKNPRNALPEELRETFVAGLVQDKISSQHPVGSPVVAPLLDAVGVLHVTPQLFSMPDDPALGEFRAEFAGMLGLIEERPGELDSLERASHAARVRWARGNRTGFEHAAQVESTDDLYDHLRVEPERRVDARALLTARLMDLLVGDWDRHPSNYRWARLGPSWKPIPVDRDMAFSRFDGLVMAPVREVLPELTDFGPRYPGLWPAVKVGLERDRLLLAGLSRADWDSVAAWVRSRLTDSVIGAAVAKLPSEYLAGDGPRLTQALGSRRGELEAIAARFYDYLAGYVDVLGTDQDDEAMIERHQDGSTTVRLSSGGVEYFRRRFHPEETREIRIYLGAGNDGVAVRGEEGRGRSGSPRVRIIGGVGDDGFEVPPVLSRGIRLYDSHGTNQVPGDSRLERRRWESDDSVSYARGPRDWGRRPALWWPTGGYRYDVGVILGIAGRIAWYGFRRLPYATRLEFSAEAATDKGLARLGIEVTRQLEGSRRFVRLEAVGSRVETLRWYGLGNATVSDPDPDFHRVRRRELLGAVRLGIRLGDDSELSAGPEVRWSSTRRQTVIAALGPFGSDPFSLVGGSGTLRLERRDRPRFARRGYALEVRASAYPAWWDATDAVVRIEGRASLAVAPPKGWRWRPSLHLLAGGIKTWGEAPFFLAATIGGLGTLRGYRPDRFAGEAALYGGAEARIPVTRAKLLFPGEQGVFGFADLGRVYLTGEEETGDRWHRSVGGGVWLSFLSARHTVFAGLGWPVGTGVSAEGKRFLLGFGFPY
ncbi:MAG: BamA/TamA family outer membrane protein [Gemmatimonadales bacterium]